MLLCCSFSILTLFLYLLLVTSSILLLCLAYLISANDSLYSQWFTLSYLFSVQYSSSLLLCALMSIRFILSLFSLIVTIISVSLCYTLCFFSFHYALCFYTLSLTTSGIYLSDSNSFSFCCYSAIH